MLEVESGFSPEGGKPQRGERCIHRLTSLVMILGVLAPDGLTRKETVRAPCRVVDAPE